MYNHVKVCSPVHLEQQLLHAFNNRHFSTYIPVRLAVYMFMFMFEVITLKKIHGFCDTTCNPSTI